jgi:uncharacterized coiled-coil protein SlyX
MAQASDSILELNPVTFHYNADLSEKEQFGLIAEEVEKVNPDLVVHDADGSIYTVRYEAINAMLLNEFLKEHRKVREQEATITELKSTDTKQAATIAELQQQIGALVATVNKVSDQVQLRKAAGELANNRQTISYLRLNPN